MNEPESRAAAEYRSALDSILSGENERGLAQGFDLVRRDAEGAVGLLKIVDIHHAALRSRLTGVTPEDARTLDAAGELLAASLASFEMTHRGYRETVRDLQRLNRELEQRTVQLAAANEELESFGYSVSHDLRAPLRAIVGFSRMLLDGQRDRLSDDGKDLLERVISAGKKMTGLIDGLLGLAQIDRAQFSRENVDLSAMAREIDAELREAAPSRSVETIVAPGLVANGDPRMLRALMTNLLSNAWKFTAKHPHARIEFGSSIEDGRPAYFVKDDGDGFDARRAENLFLPFQRLHGADEFEGTGIGLSTVRRIVQRHGGRIRAEGRPGAGAIFYFTL